MNQLIRTALLILLVTCANTHAQVVGTPYILPGNYYDVYYDANGGTGTDPISQHGAYAYTAPASPYTRAGYTFTGWNTAPDGTGNQYAPGTKFTPTAPTNLYAQWGQNAVAGTTGGTCVVGTVINDNNLTACGTTRTWQCEGLNGGATADGTLYNGDCPVVGTAPATCDKGTVTADNGLTACGTTRTWQCVLNGGTADGTYYNGDCPVVGTAPATCDKGTVTADNGLTACGTTRTWQCVLNGGTANGTYYNGDCPVVGTAPATCDKGTVTADNGLTACGTTRTWQCVLNGGTANGTYTNGPCPVVGTTPGTCTVGTKTADNNATACGTTRTWVCTSGVYAATGSSSNQACPTHGSCSGNYSCSVGTLIQLIEDTACAKNKNSYCVGTDGMKVLCSSDLYIWECGGAG